MFAPWSRYSVPISAGQAGPLSVRVAILFLPFFLALLGCAGFGRKEARFLSGVVHTENGVPIEGATIRIQTTKHETTSGKDGRFTLSVPGFDRDVSLTAWAPGYFIAGPLQVNSNSTNIAFALRGHASSDSAGYQWITSKPQTSREESESCGLCHSAQGSGLSHSLPYDEWLLDAHAGSARNPRFLTMYTGSDTLGNQSPPTQLVNTKDYGTEPLRPDATVPYYGPGYKLDFPNTAGNCATCHAPVAAVSDPTNTDPTQLDGVAAEGVTCDFCHKIWEVNLDPGSGLPHQNMPGVTSYTFRRPPEGQQFFAGPFDDVAPGEDTYLPLQTESQFCAPCHHGVFWDIVIYDSFGEWLASPYSDPENGQTCQDCHMPRLGAEYFALPEQGGRMRDPGDIFSHRMPGASDELLLKNAVSMTTTAEFQEGILLVHVELVNDQTGHMVPTGSPLRHLILLINAVDDGGRPLVQRSGPRLPNWCGEGDPADGYYAGLPGMVYAKVLAEQWTNVSPTAAYWNPTYVVSDNRLKPFTRDETAFRFAAPAQNAVTVQVRLIYRRAFIELAEQKRWRTPDIVIGETILEIGPRPATVDVMGSQR